MEYPVLVTLSLTTQPQQKISLQKARLPRHTSSVNVFPMDHNNNKSSKIITRPNAKTENSELMTFTSVLYHTIRSIVGYSNTSLLLIMDFPLTKIVLVGHDWIIISPNPKIDDSNSNDLDPQGRIKVNSFFSYFNI